MGFRNVFEDELELIYQSRLNREVDGPRPERGKPVYEQAKKMGLQGLAFSGGGIRSATFNLGVLQALARLGLLSKFDYLSTVSGGGATLAVGWCHGSNAADSRR